MSDKPTDSLFKRIDRAIVRLTILQNTNVCVFPEEISLLTDCRKEIEGLKIEVSRLESLADNYERGLGI